MRKILLSMGTRPEIIKMAPIYHEMKRQGMRPLLLHTGQHSDMAASLYAFFDITPDYQLQRELRANVACDLSVLSSTLLKEISGVLLQIKPDTVLVHGDTSSAFIAALAAFYQQRRVAHVEAGLRSHQEYNPFPEEKNRALIARLSHWHFAPTPRARANLLAEGIEDSRIHVVGNTIIEAATLGAAKGMSGEAPELMRQIAGGNRKLVMVTAHRRENQQTGLKRIAQAVSQLLIAYPDLAVVWPVHPNPKVRRAVYGEIGCLPPALANRLHLTDPLPYPALLWLLKNSWLALTDSGGIQEEAVALGTPVLVLRETTERPEVIETGAGLMVGTEPANILLQVKTLHENPEKYDSMRRAKNPFGDGRTARHICRILNHDATGYSYEEAKRTQL